MARTMAYAMFGRVLLEVHVDAEPEDDEWDLFLDTIVGYAAKGVEGSVVMTDGPGPNPRQRRKLSAVRMAANVPTAVLTRSVIARGAVTAMNWMGHAIKPFHPEHMEPALRYANVPMDRVDAALHAVARMKCDLIGLSLERLEAEAILGAPADVHRHVVSSRVDDLLRARAVSQG